MHRTLVSVFLASLALAGRGNLAPAQQLQGATPSGRLELTSTSETAKREFEQLIFEFTNLRPLFARQHAMNALAADPSFGLARVYLGFAAMNPQLTAGERAAEAARGLAALSTASTSSRKSLRLCIAPKMFDGRDCRQRVTIPAEPV